MLYILARTLLTLPAFFTNTINFYSTAGMDNYCSADCIEKWLKSHKSFASYNMKIKPGLSEETEKKQVTFSKHVLNRWGLPATQKLLRSMADEKWFWGLVARTFSKCCPDIGVNKKAFSVHHKSHISKVMGHATVACLFTDSPEQGCEGFAINLSRCQAYTLCQRMQYEATRDAETGKLTHI
jgi:hypothetical protein